MNEILNNIPDQGWEILEQSRSRGWVLEPMAKSFMEMTGLDIPKFYLGSSSSRAGEFLKQCKSGVVAKCVSSQILHKTEYGAVRVGIHNQDQLKEAFRHFKLLPGFEEVLVEEMLSGVELLVGAKIDYQFGPVIVMGIGGTGVEVYKDTTIRMAPLKPGDVLSMVNSLIGKDIISGHRGQQGVDMDVLTRVLVQFSHTVMEMEDRIESIDLNPVICTPDRCVVADARIILASEE
ncbi:MAG: acetyl-CoA synthetase [Desulfobacteraceae bacterium]|nr:MAG: acetyl-CoA synthetase [Desulfobacteraceae bacterium]